MLNPRLSPLNGVCAALVVAICISAPATSVLARGGNTPGSVFDQDAAGRSDITFDVVSIRPSNAGLNQWHLGAPAGGDQYDAIGLPLGNTILMAYLPYRLQSKERIIGAPSWVWNERYDIVGKTNEADLADWQKLTQRGLMVQNPMLQTMLRNALADRCRLIVHRVPTKIEGYALVLAKHGPNRKRLVESKTDEVIPDRALKMSLGARVVPIYSHDDPVLHFYQTSMAAFVLFLSGSAPIEDKTGLAGRYRFDLTRLGTDGIPTSDWDLAPLGLKLVPAKIHAQDIVIDHIERPSPN